MMIIVQVVELETGCRSEIMKAERHELAKCFESSFQGEDYPKRENHAVLVLVDDIKEGWDFSRCPLMTVQRYIDLFLLKEQPDNGREILQTAT